MDDSRVEAGAAQAKMMGAKALHNSRTQPVAVHPLTGAPIPRSLSRGSTTRENGLHYRKMADPKEQDLLESTFFTVHSPGREEAEVRARILFSFAASIENLLSLEGTLAIFQHTIIVSDDGHQQTQVEELQAKMQEPKKERRPWVSDYHDHPTEAAAAVVCSIRVVAFGSVFFLTSLAPRHFIRITFTPNVEPSLSISLFAPHHLFLLLFLKVPSRSTNADFARGNSRLVAKKGSQLEKVVPHKSTKDLEALGGLLQVRHFNMW